MGGRRRRGSGADRRALLAAAALGVTSTASAEELVPARATRLLEETGENTTVIDAFDRDDPFDGIEVFPWEARERFERLVLDFKARGSYHSPGRDYSELFDALGSSAASSLRAPNPGAYKAGADGFTSVADPDAKKVYFTGITDQQAFGSVALSSGVTWQAREYLKLSAGLGLTFVQDHLITAADACNPDFKTDAAASGPCRTGARTAGGGSATGIPNPNHRQVIDLPGRRFEVDDTTIVDVWLSGVAMF
jgi:hypothetical protein